LIVLCGAEGISHICDVILKFHSHRMHCCGVQCHMARVLPCSLKKIILMYVVWCSIAVFCGTCHKFCGTLPHNTTMHVVWMNP